jgi:hypothetical protein
MTNRHFSRAREEPLDGPPDGSAAKDLHQAMNMPPLTCSSCPVT